MKQFLDYRLDAEARRLWRLEQGHDAVPVPLTPRAFDLLSCLVEHPGRLVGHDELLTQVWHDAHVLPEVLKTQILLVRNALKDDAGSPRYIETVRGKGYRFIAPVADTHRLQASSAPDLHAFVGRHAQLEELEQALLQAVQGTRQIVFVVGEPGIGKSRLVERFIETRCPSHAAAVARGRCIEVYGGTEPYYPVLEALGDLSGGPAGGSFVDKLRAMAPMWAMQMPARLSEERRQAIRQSVAGADRGRMLREICELLESVTIAQPLVLLLEDLHWADHASLDVIATLAQRPYRARLMLLATYRPEDPASGTLRVKAQSHDLLVRRMCREIALGPLGEAEAAELVTGAGATGSSAQELARLVWRRAGGNPLFMMATLDDLLERGIVARSAGGWALRTLHDPIGVSTPRTLRQLLEARIQALTPEQSQALEAGSIAGLTFCSLVSAAAAGMSQEAFEDLCDELARRESFICRDEVRSFPGRAVGQCYRFKHQLYQDAFRDRPGPARRARLHRLTAESWESVLDREASFSMAAELAWHFEQGRDLQRALSYLRVALMTASRRFAHREAAALNDRGLAMAGMLPAAERTAVEAEFLERKATIYGATRDARARQAYQRLADLAARGGLLDVQARALVGLAFALSWAESHRSLEILAEALQVSAQALDPHLKAGAELSARVWRIWISGWDPAEARRCEIAFEQLQHGGHPLSIAAGKIEMSMILLLSSRCSEAQQMAESGCRTLLSHDSVRQDCNMARALWMSRLISPWALAGMGEPGRSLEQLDVGIAAFAESGNRYGRHTLLWARALVLFHCLDFRGVLDIANAVAAENALPYEDADAQMTAPVAETRRLLIFTGLAEAELGDFAGASGHLLQAQQQMQEQPAIFDWYWSIILDWGLASLALGKGDTAEALAQAGRLVERAGRAAERTWQALAWEIHARAALCTDPGTAARSIARALAITEENATPLVSWRVHATAAAVSQAAGLAWKAQEHAHRSAEEQERLGRSLPEGALRKTFLSRASWAAAHSSSAQEARAQGTHG